MTHGELLAAILLAHSRGNTRLLRANAGRGWTGKIIHQDNHRIILSPYRPFHAMPEGTPDILGFVGAEFACIEVKAGRDRVRPAQQTFIDVVLACGGRAGVARSLDDAHQILRGEPK